MYQVWHSAACARHALATVRNESPGPPAGIQSGPSAKPNAAREFMAANAQADAQSWRGGVTSRLRTASVM